MPACAGTTIRPLSRFITVEEQKVMSRLPLEGVRIADFGWILAAPQCTAWLAVMGAEVIRIESHKRLDPIRFIGQNPRELKGPDGSPLFNGRNYSKKSVTLNLGH